MNTTSFATRIDVRQIPPRERHPLIFSSFDALQVGESIELVNDHDPRPLRFQFEDRTPGQFEWSYIDSGPALWRVQIARVAPGNTQAREDSCCSGGGCCG